MQFNDEEFKEKLQAHKRWRLGDPNGVRLSIPGAYLYGAYLRGAYLYGAYLRGADLRGAYLRGADLRGANLSGANLSGANLSGANLSGANLYDADLRGAYLSGADLYGAYLRGADLRGAYLSGADLSGANLEEVKALPHHQICPEEGSFVGYKKTREGLILTLLIPEDAKRTSSLVGRKCRASKLHVLKVETLDGQACENTEFRSKYDSSFTYKLGETVECPDYDGDIRMECRPGLHFFMTKREAIEY